MYLLSRACILESSLSFKCFISFNNAITSCPLSPFRFFSLSIPASLSCSTPEGSESQLSVLSLFAMEGCRYKGMQCRLPEVSQWMDRAEKRRACVRFMCVCNLPLHLHIPIIIWLRAAFALHRKHRSIHMEDTLVTSVTLNISCCTAEPPDTHLQCTPRPLQHHQLKSQMYGHGCINSVLAQTSNSHTESNNPDHRSHGTLKNQQTVRGYNFI